MLKFFSCLTVDGKLRLLRVTEKIGGQCNEMFLKSSLIRLISLQGWKGYTEVENEKALRSCAVYYFLIIQVTCFKQFVCAESEV